MNKINYPILPVDKDLLPSEVDFYKHTVVGQVDILLHHPFLKKIRKNKPLKSPFVGHPDSVPYDDEGNYHYNISKDGINGICVRDEVGVDKEKNIKAKYQQEIASIFASLNMMPIINYKGEYFSIDAAKIPEDYLSDIHMIQNMVLVDIIYRFITNDIDHSYISKDFLEELVYKYKNNIDMSPEEKELMNNHNIRNAVKAGKTDGFWHNVYLRDNKALFYDVDNIMSESLFREYIDLDFGDFQDEVFTKYSFDLFDDEFKKFIMDGIDFFSKYVYFYYKDDIKRLKKEQEEDINREKQDELLLYGGLVYRAKALKKYFEFDISFNKNVSFGGKEGFNDFIKRHLMYQNK